MPTTMCSPRSRDATDRRRITSRDRLDRARRPSRSLQGSRHASPASARPRRRELRRSRGAKITRSRRVGAEAASCGSRATPRPRTRRRRESPGPGSEPGVLAPVELPAFPRRPARHENRPRPAVERAGTSMSVTPSRRSSTMSATDASRARRRSRMFSAVTVSQISDIAPSAKTKSPFSSAEEASILPALELVLLRFRPFNCPVRPPPPRLGRVERLGRIERHRDDTVSRDYQTGSRAVKTAAHPRAITMLRTAMTPIPRLTFGFALSSILMATPIAAVRQAPAFFPVDEIRPGMVGVGRTVFAGDQIEEFQVHILGVLRNMAAPQRDLILARLEGGPLARTGRHSRDERQPRVHQRPAAGRGVVRAWLVSKRTARGNHAHR